MLLFMDPEKGTAVSTESVMPRFAQLFPKAQIIGRLPRAPKQVSTADEEGDTYISPLDIAPHSKFSRAVHEIAEATCQAMNLRPPLPMPRAGLWHRLFGNRMTRRPADVIKRPAIVNE